MKLSDYKLQHMGWKGNMTYDEMVSHLNRIQPRKTIQNQKNHIEDEIKAITKRSRKSENNDECPNDSEDEKKTAMKRSRKSENNDECPNDSEDENKTAMKRSRKSENNNECSNGSKDEKKTAMKRSRKSENNDECSNDSQDENKTAMKRSRKSENNDECSNDSEDGNKTAMKKSRKSENNDECPNTSKGLEGNCNEDSRFMSDDMVIKAVESNEHIKELKKPKPQNSPITSRLNVSTKISKGVLNSAKIKQSHQEIITKDTACEDIRFVTDDIREMRKSKCSICGDLFLSSQIRHHIKDKHGVSLNEFGPIKDINNSFYR